MKKAQLFTLDLMLSFALVVLAIGLTIHSFELNTYSLREEELYNELKNKAETASLMLSINEKLNCSVQGTNIRMQNCLQKDVLGNLSLKEQLGLSDFKCRIVIDSQALDDCRDDFSTANNVVSIKKKMLVFNSSITKTIWNNCVTSGCSGNEKTLTIYVWRS
jgi:hypothetical protein